MKTLITALLILIASTFPSTTASSSPELPTPPQTLLQERLDFQKELEMELSVFKKIKLTDEQKRQLLKLDLELEQKKRLLD